MSDEYCTPAWLAAMLPVVDLDPASNARSTVPARRAVTLPENGLDGEHWVGARSVWINPPYSAPAPWCAMAVRAASVGADVAMLVKLDPTTRWWASLFGPWHTTTVHLFRERLAFELPSKRLVANFPSALVVLGPRRGARDAFVRTVNRLRMREAVW